MKKIFVSTLMLVFVICVNAQTNSCVNLIKNGRFNTGTNGWTYSSIDQAGGWRSTGGNPDGYFILNYGGECFVDPTIQQTVSGFVVGETYVISGDRKKPYTCCGNPSALSFGVAVDGNVILELSSAGTEWTHFAISFVATSTTHVISIMAERNCDDTEYGIDNIAVKNCPAPSSGFVATNITGTTARLNWDVVSCGKGYKVQYRVKGTTTWKTVSTTGNVGYIDITALSPNSTYQWRVATKCKTYGVKTTSKYTAINQFATAASALITQKPATNAYTSSNSLVLAPNPVSGTLTIQFSTEASTALLQITNLSGQVLHTQKLSGLTHENVIKTDVTKFAPGAYFILIQTGNKIMREKFIKV